jgi:putative SOS response-associated peptidase YedK
MCNLYSQKKSLQEVRDWFNVISIDPSAGNLPEQAAIFPSYSAPVVYLENNERKITMMNWGFVLSRSGKAAKHVNNCRGDKVITSQFWKGSFFNRRCLVPASKFSEYHPSARNKKGHKASVWFEVSEEPIFAFAGIWTEFTGKYKGELESFKTHSIITTTPNELVKPIHPSRMPVIIKPSNYESWLNGTIEIACELIIKYPANKMRIANIGLNRDD